MWLLFFINSIFANPDLPEQPREIVVEAYRDIQIYVSPIIIIDATTQNNIEAVVDSDASFTYSGIYSNAATVPNGYGGYQPVSLSERNLRIYNEKTIKLVWENCNYRRDALMCSVKNDHYYLETKVIIDDNELVVRSTLYDSDAQIVNTSSVSDRKTINWIRQQELTVIERQNFSGSTTVVNKPKEELPIKWEIPHNLTNSHIRKSIIRIWTGVKLEK